jgi:hypothetical protein
MSRAEARTSDSEYGVISVRGAKRAARAKSGWKSGMTRPYPAGRSVPIGEHGLEGHPHHVAAAAVTIFALTDRGQAFQAAACTTILLLVTLLALVGLGRIRGRAAVR